MSKIGLGFDQLLGTPVQQADMRIDTRDHLAVQLEHEPQHAVSGRMLRTKIDGEVSETGRLLLHRASGARRLPLPL
jgi:hypothetical protein